MQFFTNNSSATITVKLWKVWTQESFQKVEFDRPGERSRWFTNLEQTPLNRSQQLPAPHKRLIDEIKQN